MPSIPHLPNGQDPLDKGQVAVPTPPAPFSLGAARRVGFYVDGFNLYHAIDALNEPPLKWLDLASLAQSYAQEPDQLVRVVFFTAFVNWDVGKRKRHVEYVKALEARGVEVILSNFDTITKKCRTEDRYCRFKEEKQTDVGLAVSILSDCYDGLVDRVMMVSADSDQIPLAKQVRTRFPNIEFNMIAPPNRLSHARELGKHVTSRLELTAGRLRQHPLPQNVEAGGLVVARRPASYGPRAA